MIRRLFLVLFLLALGFAAGFFVKPQVKVVVFNQQEYDKLLISIARNTEETLEQFKNDSSVDPDEIRSISMAMKPVLKLGPYWVYYNSKNNDYMVANADTDQPIATRCTEEGKIDISFHGIGLGDAISFHYKEDTGEFESGSVSLIGKGDFDDVFRQIYIDTDGDGVLDKWGGFRGEEKHYYELDGLAWVNREKEKSVPAESE